MMLKYFKLSFSIRLRRRPVIRQSRRSLSYVLQVALLPSTLLRNHTSVKLHVKHQCHPKNNPIGKTKKPLAKQRRLCICIDFSLYDFSQLLRRKSIKTSLSNCLLATEKRQFFTTSLSFRYLCDFCRHISLYDTFACLTWQIVAFYLCFRHQSVNETFARKRLGTTNV